MLRANRNKVDSGLVRWRQLLYSRAFTIFAVLGIAVVGVAMVKEIIRQVEINQQVSTLEQQIGQLQQKNQDLDTLLEYFNSSSFQEKQMKERLNVQSPGEHVIIIPNQSTPDSGAVQVAPKQAEPVLSNITKWKKYFFNS